MADAYYRLKKYRESISFYKDFISSPASNSIPEKIDAYYNMAYAYKQREEFIRASENFRIYIQSNPDNLSKMVDASFRVADQFYIEKRMHLRWSFMKKHCHTTQSSMTKHFTTWLKPADIVEKQMRN